MARNAAEFKSSRFFLFSLDSPAVEEAMLAHCGGFFAPGRRSALPSSAAFDECFHRVLWSSFVAKRSLYVCFH